MTAQEIFDRVWRHFVTEGNRHSLSEHGKCVYRGTDGTRCAVGVLIPDDEYDPKIDRYTCSGVSELLRRRHCPPSLLALCEHDGLLMALQSAHDNTSRADTLEHALRSVARVHGLTVPA